MDGLAVWSFQGDQIPEVEWRRHLNDMQELTTWTHLEARPCVIIHAVDNRFSPNAAQRKEISEISAHPAYRPNLALVNDNALARGAILAFSWLQKNIAYQIKPFRTVEEGITWLEQERGSSLAQLRRMVQETTTRLRNEL